VRLEAVHCDRLLLSSDVDVKVLGPLAYHSVRAAVGRRQGAGCLPFLMYTISAAARCAGTSIGSGCGSSLVVMAASACCRSTAAGDVSFGNEGWAGRVRAAPYTTSAADVLLSVLGAVLMFSRTQLLMRASMQVLVSMEVKGMASSHLLDPLGDVALHVAEVSALLGCPWLQRLGQGVGQRLVVGVEGERPALQHEPEVQDP